MYEEVVDEQVADEFMATKKEHDVMLAECERKFLAAETWRRTKQTRWEKYYKLSQSHAERVEGQWGSIVFVPLIFTIIETIKARMVAQLPVPIVIPVGPDDQAQDIPDPEGVPDPMTGEVPMVTIDPAREMEDLLRWSAMQSGLYLELVKAFDSALRYGTGILKVTADKRSVTRRKRMPKMVPVQTPQSAVIDPETGQEFTDPDGNPVMDVGAETGEMQPDPAGAMETVEEEVITYVGPRAESIDLFQIFVDPMATSFEDAEYVIHRMYKPKSWVQARFDNGFFRKPDFFEDEEWQKLGFVPEDEPAQMRMSQVDDGGSVTEDDRVEVRECWYRDGTVLYSLDRRIVVRVVKTPFDHGEFPFIRIIDHLMPHEFYGVGEIQHLEGPQDLVNALTNQRVDNVRLKLETVFYGDARAIDDRKSLQVYPGAYIPVNNPNDQPLDQVFRQLDMGDVTSSSYNEVDFWKSVIQEVSAVTSYQTGTGDQENLNETATGVALISEQGNQRFSMKLKMAELTGIQQLYRQYGALIQQFTPEDFIMRIMGPEGPQFKQVEPAALYGAFDYDIEPMSSSQTDTVRQQQAIDLINTALSMQYPDPVTGGQTTKMLFNMEPFGEDFLLEFHKKNPERYMAPPTPPPPPPAPPMAPDGSDSPDEIEMMDEDQMIEQIMQMQGGGAPNGQQPMPAAPGGGY
jgi:hypothetical protein